MKREVHRLCVILLTLAAACVVDESWEEVVIFEVVDDSQTWSGTVYTVEAEEGWREPFGCVQQPEGEPIGRWADVGQHRLVFRLTTPEQRVRVWLDLSTSGDGSGCYQLDLDPDPTIIRIPEDLGGPLAQSLGCGSFEFGPGDDDDDTPPFPSDDDSAADDDSAF